MARISEQTNDVPDFEAVLGISMRTLESYSFEKYCLKTLEIEDAGDEPVQTVLEDENLGYPAQSDVENEDLWFSPFQTKGNWYDHLKSFWDPEDFWYTPDESDVENEELWCSPFQTKDHWYDPLQSFWDREDFSYKPVQISLECKDRWYDPVQTFLDREYFWYRSAQEMKTALKGYGRKAAWRSRKSKASQNRLLAVCISFAILNGINADIIESPENLVVLENTLVTMKCKTSSVTKPLIWAAIDCASEPISIFDGERVNPDYEALCSVKPNAGSYDLHVNATSKMALKFACIEAGANNVERSAELIVVGSDPTCAAHNASNPEYIDIVCTIILSGNRIPVMTWRANGIQAPLTVRNHTERLIDQYVKVTSTLYNVSRKDAPKYACDTLIALEKHNENVAAGNMLYYMYTSLLQQDADLPKTVLPPTLSPTSTPPLSPAPSDLLYLLIIPVCVLIVAGCLLRISYHNGFDGKKCACFESNKKEPGSANNWRVPSNDSESVLL